MKVHELKCKSSEFWRINCGQKTAELRKNDRQFQYGDYIELSEVNDSGALLSSHLLVCRITAVTNASDWPDLLQPGIVMLSFRKVTDEHEFDLVREIKQLKQEYSRLAAQFTDTSFISNIVGHGAG